MRLLYSALSFVRSTTRILRRNPGTNANEKHPEVMRASRNPNGTTYVSEHMPFSETTEHDLPPIDAVRPSSSEEDNENCSFYALVIGINNYPNLDPLRGAIADADRMANFLITNLQVPSDHITNLRDQEASRAGIIQGFHKLRDDSRIRIGDPILIYYAGHGGSSRGPRDRLRGRSANEVQVIFPHDYGVPETGSGDPVNCIPDYTIAALLDELAAEKGNNITVVFDSCHSASGSRDAFGVFSSTQPRYAPVLYEIPKNIDADIFKTSPVRQRKSRSVEPILCTDQGSHVLLAACGSREKAWEQDQQGQFTTALLGALRTCGAEKLTYHNLLISLPTLANQSPHCYGANKSRIIFDSRISAPKNAYIPVTFEKNALALGAGAASGIISGSIWELHLSASYDSRSCGRFVAKNPGVSTTALSPLADKDEQSIKLALGQEPRVRLRLYARQVGAGTGNELKAWFSPHATEILFRDSDQGGVSHLSTPSEHEIGYIHHSREGADIEVEVCGLNSAPERREAVFSINDPVAQANGVSRLEHRKPARRRDVELVLFAAAKWNWHLRRTNTQYIEEARQSIVKMEMCKVGEKVRVNRRGLFQDPEPVPIRYDEKGITGLVEFVARDRDLYGIKLSNRRSVPLHVRMFFFDATDFSIVHLFGHSASNGHGDPELPADGELIIGDGGDGGSPLKFTIPPTKKVEVGYLKVFWSTDPLELDNITQTSAFDLKSSRGVTKVSKDRVMKDWGTQDNHAQSTFYGPSINPPMSKTPASSQLSSQATLSPGSSKAQALVNTRWSGARLHALVIGIDNYPKLPSLSGSIADAGQMERFLISDLKVPKENIITLYDRYAFRQAIINSFRMMQADPRIRQGDPILIFFAGHGGLTDAQPVWKRKHGSSKIQVIFPYDYYLPIGNSNDYVNCIPDITIAELLNQLAAAKGNNITVIFDSCHSASGTRDELEQPGLRARSADVQFPIPHDIDDDILAHSSLGTKLGRSSELLLYSDQSSHIHISACGSNQKAWEDNGKGQFTAILLDTLRKSRVDNITYENLLKSLPALSSQSPHCYGQNKNRILFDSHLDIHTRVFIPVVCDIEGGSWTLLLQAGEESGVTEHSVWDLHETTTEDSRPCAKVIAGFPEIGTTSLGPKSKQDAMWLDQLARGVPRHAEIRMYARHLRAGQGTALKVWCPFQSLQDLLRPRTTAPNAIEDTTHEVGYVMQRDRNNADLELDVYPRISPGDRLTSKSEVLFRLRNPIAEGYGVSELRYRKPAVREEIETVLFAAAKWKWHLERTNWYPQNKLPQIESMTMMKVATRIGGKREYLEKPIAIREAPRGLVEFVAKSSDLYGIELISRSKLPLYIRIFYFDATDFSIGDVFGQTVANGSEDATILEGGRIVIGDGRDGGSPLKFSVSPKNRLELGYLKAFWCTSPLELSDLAQKSAFEMRPGSMGRAVSQVRLEPVHDWGTMCLTLVMKAA
ncbi:unnamed protein product [Rhizoctonia solani]|uniref:Peptidase C14 caspase domain-containing protein n=1 Tax=Rhizoctonia solani TaxID=456999 RepID=A0A8H3A3W1_9AGAM|nr:unnamed protein product [Rhizoctonia solani]